MARGYRPNGAQRTPPTHRNSNSNSGSYLKRALWRAVLVYITFISLFTCPSNPGHPVCRAEAAVHTSLVAPVHNLILSTETGARVDAAYKAHLVPFYEKHGAPVVNGAQSFVCDTVVPTLKKAVQPASDAVCRIAGPHVGKVSALYTAHAKPTVDAVGSAVYSAVNRLIIPVTSTVFDRTACGVKEYVIPFGRSAVNDHIIPFYSNHVHPRWNHQVKPALCRYSKVAVEYTRTSVLPAIADGATYGYSASRDFAAAYVVPHTKRVTVHVYSFVKKHVCPPVRSVYERTLKPHVDRIVPWDKVQTVSDKLSTAVCTTFEVSKGFVEEFYFMCYTIATGNEHPAVIARLRAAAEDSKRKDSGIVDSLKGRVFPDSTASSMDNGQLQHMARRVSGSARQWVQVARGWLGSAVGNAKDGVASYRSRFEQTASIQFSEATSVAGAVTEIVASLAQDAVSIASVVQETEEPAVDIATSTSDSHADEATPLVEPVIDVVNDTVASIVDEHLEQTSKPEYASVTEHADEATSIAESVAESVVEPVVESAADPVVELAKEAISAVTPEASKLEEKAIAAESVAESIAEEVVVENFASVTSEVEPVISKQPAETTEDTPVVPSIVADVKENIEFVLKDDEPSSLSETEEAITTSEAEERKEKKIVPEITTVISIVELPATKKEPLTSSSTVEPVPTKKERVEEHVADETSANTKEAASIVAEEAASVVYDAREAMAGVVLDKDDVSKFEELVKSATKVTENLEAFPSVVMDTEELDAETTTAINAAPKKPEATPEDDTLGPEAVVESGAAGEKPAKPDTPLAPASDENDMTSVTTTVLELKEEEQPVSDEVPVAKEEQQTPATLESQAQDTTVDEDVRKSASNWVKDARKSISKELAEERTRVGPLVVDSPINNDALPVSASLEGAVVSESEATVPSAPKIEQVVVPEDLQEPKAEDTVVTSASVSVPEMVVQEEPKQVIEIPKVEHQAPRAESPAKASKTEPAAADNVAKSTASKSEMSGAAAPAPAPGEQDSVDGNGTMDAEKQTPPLKRQKKPATVTAATATATDESKGPRKVKKTKKRVVKKTAAAAAPTASNAQASSSLD
ncbi:hypothetical protein IW140_005076 [Coemansia sp. RSA 1813]|nr:hypothetical protein EV178_002193 [Coemansia sp. RSA 1646]KAJ1769267.1 hypothetical protein LPJ74_004204 [Coemansia sp. RSA 1843]KAJ2090307.1 hypothetical protein IW138_002733 [Coemansia sp. RSA 986]KAJ2215497.1 hypothetical protein EV179_002090 [Coemansia sp. RSA 487]KAJ2566093.1 hypothetical protein IW140_005076 [Coemansia sp. RSA 1813]